MKNFTNFPAELEHFNPVVLSSITEDLTTFDEKNLLHSYNDEPSKVEVAGKGQALSWHFHGKLYRENDKPVMVSSFEDYFYRTNDAGHNAHSYEGRPAIMQTTDYNELTIIWSEHGSFHRENDLPAELVWKYSDDDKTYYLIEEKYFKNGERHREANLPAFITPKIKAWYIKDISHNTNGSSWSRTNRDSSVTEKWSLYGVQMPETLFNAFKQVEKEQNLPSWVAFLLTFEIMEEKFLDTLFNNDGTWDLKVPFSWVMRSLGLTDETFIESLKLFRKKTGSQIHHPKNNLDDKTLFEGFVDVVTFELEEDLLKIKEVQHA
jgi:hypothetical protein